VWNIFKQIFCWFYDGTSRHLNSFDQLKRDEGYASVIENGQEEMVSLHQITRFYKSFSWVCGGQFRKILRKMFIWRLRLERPEVIDLTLDTMVMDNDEAQKRYGVQPTYKKVKGFQPLQAIWKGKIVDAIFRGGKKHSNYGNSVVNMMRSLVQVIRQEYSETVTFSFRMTCRCFFTSGTCGQIQSFKKFTRVCQGFSNNIGVVTVLITINTFIVIFHYQLPGYKSIARIFISHYIS